MSEAIDGWIEPPLRTRLPSGIVLTGKPMVRVSVRVNDRIWGISFMIDTGADVTIVQPRDAYLLFGASLFNIDFQDRRASFPVVGAGAETFACVTRPATYLFRTTEGRHHAVRAPILVAQPSPSEPSNAGNWTQHSTLGRDVLHRLSLRLDYRAEPAVVLSA